MGKEEITLRNYYYWKNEIDAFLNEKEDKSNKTSSWNSETNDNRYPTEKLVKTTLDTKENTSNKISSWNSTTNNTRYPTEKLVKTSLDGKINTSALVNDLTTGGTSNVLSAEQGKVLKGEVDGKSNLGHTHDDRYYTESEIDNKLASKENNNNKTLIWTNTPDNTRYPTEKLVKDSLDEKIDTSTIKNDLITGGSTNVLSAEQGKELKGLIDNRDYVAPIQSNNLDYDSMGKAITAGWYRVYRTDKTQITDLPSSLPAIVRGILKVENYNGSTTYIYGQILHVQTNNTIFYRKGLVSGENVNWSDWEQVASINDIPDISGKVDKEEGKGLSTNDYTTTEKNKLANIEEQANNYTHPSYTARTGKPTSNQTPAFGGTATVSQITSDVSGHVTGATDRTIKIPNTEASTTASGLMSKDDKTKLDGISTGAKNVSVEAKGSGTIEIAQITVDGTTTSIKQRDNNTTYTAASATPNMDGTGAVGTSAKYAREDHVHPTDTSRASTTVTDDLQTQINNITNGVTPTDHNHDSQYIKTGTGTVTTTNIANGTIKNEDISTSAAIAQSKINNLTNDLTAKNVTLTKLSTPTNNTYIATYEIKQGGTSIGKIDIPKDFLIQSASLEHCTTANTPLEGLSVGDPYIHFVANTNDGTQTAKTIDINVKDLVDTYSAGAGLTLSDNTFRVNFGSSTTTTANYAVGCNDARLSNTRTPTDNTVTTAKIVDGNVTTAKLANSSVTSAKIADGTIVNGDIANTTIQGGKLVNGTITATQLASNAVETAKIKDANITTAKIADSNITTAKIANSNITTAKIADNAITIDKIAFTGDIGGTNLLLGTQSFSTGTNGTITGEIYKGCEVRRYNNTDGTTYMDCQWNGMPVIGEFKQGERYTLSFWAKGTGTIICYSYGTGSYLGSKPIKSSGGSHASVYGDGSCTFTLTSDWKRYYVTWELNPQAADSTLTSEKKLLIRTNKGSDSYIAGVMFERGEIAHDWSANPNETHANRIYASSSATKDLNNFTNPGYYYNNNNTQSSYISNLPVSGKAFFLHVESWGYDNYTKQTVTVYNTNATYTRVKSNGTWGSWKEISANTTYSAEKGITLSSGKFGHSNAAITAQSTSGLYKITYDAYGHITGATAVAKADITGLGIPGSDTNTTYSANDGIKLDGTTFKHNSGTGTAQTTQSVYSIKFDKFGHINAATAVSSMTPTSHTHGSLANGGTLNSDITSVNKVAVTDSSNNLKTIAKVPFANLNISKTDITNLGIPGSDTNTTYTANDGIKLDGTTFKHNSGTGTAQTTQSVYSIKFDKFGHINSATAVSSMTPTNGSVTNAKVASNAAIEFSKLSGVAASNHSHSWRKIGEWGTANSSSQYYQLMYINEDVNIIWLYLSTPSMTISNSSWTDVGTLQCEEAYRPRQTLYTRCILDVDLRISNGNALQAVRYSGQLTVNMTANFFYPKLW